MEWDARDTATKLTGQGRHLEVRIALEAFGECRQFVEFGSHVNRHHLSQQQAADFLADARRMLQRTVEDLRRVRHSLPPHPCTQTFDGKDTEPRPFRLIQQRPVAFAFQRIIPAE